MKVVLIYNATSGGERNLRELKRMFKNAGIAVTYSFTVKQLSSRKLLTLIKQGVIVAAVGGDGALNAVARLIVHTKSSLLPLPGGTFNHFIRDIGASPLIEDTLANIDTAVNERIDVGYVNDELFLNNSNLGLYPFSLIERKQTKKVLGKWVAAGLSVVDQLSVFKRHSLVIDGERVKSPFVFVGNNIYDIKRSLIPQRENLTKGVLTIMVATSSSRMALIRAIGAVMKDDISNRDDFTLSHRTAMSIYSDRATIPVSFDGEVKGLAPPLLYRTEPKALRVLVVKSQ